MVLHIKNMVCDRCKWVVRTELEKQGFSVDELQLGQAIISPEPVPAQLERIDGVLKGFGFELLMDRQSQLVDRIRTLVLSLVSRNQPRMNINLSDYLAGELHRDYSSLSRLFSEQTGGTIEQFYIHQKIEKAKEWLADDQLSLTQIADELGYSSVAHLSGQFKKVTGQTPSAWKSSGKLERSALDKTL